MVFKAAIHAGPRSVVTSSRFLPVRPLVVMSMRNEVQSFSLSESARRAYDLFGAIILQCDGTKEHALFYANFAYMSRNSVEKEKAVFILKLFFLELQAILRRNFTGHTTHGRMRYSRAEKLFRDPFKLSRRDAIQEQGANRFVHATRPPRILVKELGRIRPVAGARHAQILNFSEFRGQRPFVGAVAIIFAFLRAFVAQRPEMRFELRFEQCFDE